VVLNYVNRAGVGFGSEENEVTLVYKDRAESLPRASKRWIADRILDEIKRLRGSV